MNANILNKNKRRDFQALLSRATKCENQKKKINIHVFKEM